MWCGVLAISQKESDVDATAALPIVGVDLSKSVFQLAVADGLTPKERSSSGTRHLGRISKRGDRYLRMLLTHGPRSVLRAASAATHAGRCADPLRHWTLAFIDTRGDDL